MGLLRVYEMGQWDDSLRPGVDPKVYLEIVSTTCSNPRQGDIVWVLSGQMISIQLVGQARAPGRRPQPREYTQCSCRAGATPRAPRLAEPRARDWSPEELRAPNPGPLELLCGLCPAKP